MDSKMDPNQRKRPDPKLIYMVPAIAMIVILMIIIFAPIPRIAPESVVYDPWFDRIYHFQTLIAGVAAVIAAAITVEQMRISDRRSDHRHDDLMRLQAKTELRQIERALNPQRREINEILQKLNKIKGASENCGTIDQATNYLIENSHDISVVTEAMAEIFNRPQFVEGMNYFDGELTRKCGRMRDAANALTVFLGKYQAHINSSEKNDVFEKNRIRYIFSEMTNMLADLLAELDTMHMRLFHKF